MAKIINIFSSIDEDMKDYQKKIWKHRVQRYAGYVIAAVILVLLFLGVRYYLNNRSYSGYSVVSATERNDTMTTRYASFGGKILKYSKDGVSYTDEKNNSLFSITYTMQEPLLVLNKKAGAVIDQNGNQIYIFNQIQQTGRLETLLPIKQAVVSEQGVVALLMEESSGAKLELYSPDGTLLGEGKFTLEDAGYPMNLSISADGTKLAMTFAQVSGAKYNSCVSVYNFDGVGENHVDHLVFAKNYTDYLIPEVHYFDKSTFVAVGDGILTIYQGTQIPELVTEITFEEKIKSVFYGEAVTGLVFEGQEGKILRIYDLKGNQTAEIPFTMDYEEIYIEEDRVLIYRDQEVGLYGYNGKEYFHDTFEASLENVFMTSSRSKYLLIYTNETQKIKLQ